jgi:uncharacterized LabA/DUF88 family protein
LGPQGGGVNPLDTPPYTGCRTQAVQGFTGPGFLVEDDRGFFFGLTWVRQEAAVDLATDPNVRVMVFMDGQNLYKACKRLFGHALCHPHLLAQHLAGPRNKRRIACRFYTGRPSPAKPKEAPKAKHLDRRTASMQKMGVTVVTRPLRYHWDWGHQQTLPKPGPGVSPRTVTLTPWERPQEKGIDLVLALDVVEFVLTDACDVAIVVSLDRDLYEIPQALTNLKKFITRPVRIEAAVPVPDGLKNPKTLPRFAYTHQITSAVFEAIRDDTDYAVADQEWVEPTLPATLPALPS